VKQAESWAPVCSESANTTRRLAAESNSTKIPLKRPSFLPTRHSLRVKRKELKRHITGMATAKLSDKDGSNSAQPASIALAPTAIAEVSIDENQIVISTDNIPENGVSNFCNASGRPMSRTDSVKNLFNKFVNQIAVSSSKVQVKIGRAAGAAGGVGDLGESKADAAQRRRAEEWRLYFEEQQGRVPGVIGIRNHGNTCFINSILQCLSFTDILAEYFVLDQYKSDLKRRRRLAFTKSPATMGKGEITEQLATLLKSLWSLQYDPEISDKFKSLVDKYGSQYKGGNQHDAQEFLLWLLDKVHEELNTATAKKYKRLKNLPGRSDDVIAAEALANYMRCNNSFVVDIFQAQFRSSLICPSCDRESNTFDPFLCVSLPIPQIQVRPVIITVVYLDQSPRQVRIGLTLPVHSDVHDLRESLSKDTGIETEQILITEIDDVTFNKTFNDGQSIELIEVNSGLYCIETPGMIINDEENEEEGAYIILTWINVYKEGSIEKRFGSPYTMQISREVTYTDLQKLLMKEMSPILHDDILISAQKVPLFKMRVLDGFDDRVYLDSSAELPLYMDCVETALNMSQVKDSGGPVHVKLVLEWDMPAKTQVIYDEEDRVEEHCSVQQVREAPQSGSSVTLQNCFSLYTSEERLGEDDAYFCPQCNKKRQVVKKLGVWSVPDVMVVHLKRFRQSTKTTNKLETLVDFPLENFDMSPNMARQPGGGAAAGEQAAAANVNGTAESNTAKVLSAFSPWKHPKRYRDYDRDDTVYELYSVCNHHGSDMLAGHYTAVCRNPTDGQWYSFDDVHTKQISEAEVVTKDAYILFYQKRSLNSAGGSSASSSSSSSSSSTDHWAYRMPDFVYKTKNETRCAPYTKPRTQTPGGGTSSTSTLKDKLKSTTLTSTASTATKKATNFARNTAKYATLPARRSNELSTALAEEADNISEGDVVNGDVNTSDNEHEHS